MWIFFSCKEAEKWDWLSYTPTGMDGAKFYTYLFMAEVINYFNNNFNFVFGLRKEMLPNWLAGLHALFPAVESEIMGSWFVGSKSAAS